MNDHYVDCWAWAAPMRIGAQLDGAGASDAYELEQ